VNILRKTLIRIGLVLLGLIALTLLYAFTFYPAEYTLRLLHWGESDAYDYQKFPSRPLNASPDPFYFGRTSDQERVRTLFERDPKIGDLDSFLQETGTQAFIVIQDDVLLYEEYFNSASRESFVTSFSMAKSVTSALIGMAIGEGYIHSVDDPITDYLPELAERDPAFGNITIRDLLMMSSGIKYAEFPFVSGDDAKTYYFPDLRQLVLEDTHIAAQPGEHFFYNNYHPLLLGMILERATGSTVTEYLEENIWQPVGMEFDGSWSLDEAGFEKMESGINARAIDFAKFGRLYLNDGRWNGTQIIAAEWVVDSLTEDPTTRNPDYYSESFGPELYAAANGGFYKYLWYGYRREGERADFAAEGNHGQIIYVSPAKQLIIVRNSERYGLDDTWDWIELFYHFATDIESAQ